MKFHFTAAALRQAQEPRSGRNGNAAPPPSSLPAIAIASFRIVPHGTGSTKIYFDALRKFQPDTGCFIINC